MITLDEVTFGGLDIRTPVYANTKPIETVLGQMLEESKDFCDPDDVELLLKQLKPGSKMIPMTPKEPSGILGVPEELFFYDPPVCALMWRVDDEDLKEDHDYMYAMTFEVVAKGGRYEIVAKDIVMGDLWDGFAQNRNACCKKRALETGAEPPYSMVVAHESQQNPVTLDTMFTLPGCRKMFETSPRKIIRSTKLIQDLCAHNEHGVHHRCGHDHGKSALTRRVKLV